MTARHAIAVLTLLAAGVAPICVAGTVFLGVCAAMVALCWNWDRQRVADVRRRNQARPMGGRR